MIELILLMVGFFTQLACKEVHIDTFHSPFGVLQLLQEKEFEVFKL
tara:strand:+ start:73 stop:210 length:138 start_codon:yes stop_codon:yes gene_type:complete